jgi:hypothetical protein
MLHGPLLRSLAAATGAHPMPLEHRCGLAAGHPGAHHALASHHGTRRCWFRWDYEGFRVGAAPKPAQPVADGNTAGPRRPPEPAADAADSHQRGGPRRAPLSPSGDEALWALAAAVQQLSAVIADATSPARLRAILGGQESF